MAHILYATLIEYVIIFFFFWYTMVLMDETRTGHVLSMYLYFLIIIHISYDRKDILQHRIFLFTKLLKPGVTNVEPMGKQSPTRTILVAHGLVLNIVHHRTL